MLDDVRDEVILVDEHDRPVGTSPKLAAHFHGRLHRAISVQVSDGRGRLLLQKRYVGKYHSGGLWSNTCCSHPRPGESVLDGAQRRLGQEMGFTCELSRVFVFRYRAEVGPGLWEHELDHVLTGVFDGAPDPDPAEVMDWRWATPEQIGRELRGGILTFTVWFPPAFAGLLHRTRGAGLSGTPPLDEIRCQSASERSR